METLGKLGHLKSTDTTQVPLHHHLWPAASSRESLPCFLSEKQVSLTFMSLPLSSLQPEKRAGRQAGEGGPGPP